MKNLIIVLIAVFMMAGAAKAEWVDYTDNGVVFPDIVFSQYEQTRLSGGIEQVCTITMAYIWQKTVVAGITETCVPVVIASGGDTYNTTNNTTNEIEETCNGCPIVTHKFRPVRNFKKIR